MDIHQDYSGNLLGKYQLVSKLGNGSFGAVYKVYDTILNTEKALKLIQVTNPANAEKVFKEASIPYKCQHRNIIKINGGELFPLKKDEHHIEMVFAVDMELATGTSVEGLLKKDFVPISKSLEIIKDILFAIEHSHNEGIIHRDIKPANILIDNGIPKLSDFGLASALDSLIIPPQWYITHMAPEAYKNNQATIHTDIYALGMTLYRMVNNISDWNAFLRMTYNDSKLLEQSIISGEFVKSLKYAPYVPEKIKRIIRKACSLKPEERYQSACEMRNAIIKLHINQDWNYIGENDWRAINRNGKTKEIYILSTRNNLKVIVENNGRKSSAESRRFKTKDEAVEYIYAFVKDTLLV